MEHGLKYIVFYVKQNKTYSTLHSCRDFPAGSRQASRGARICETSLFDKMYFSLQSLKLALKVLI